MWEQLGPKPGLWSWHLIPTSCRLSELLQGRTLRLSCKWLGWNKRVCAQQIQNLRQDRAGSHFKYVFIQHTLLHFLFFSNLETITFKQYGTLSPSAGCHVVQPLTRRLLRRGWAESSCNHPTCRPDRVIRRWWIQKCAATWLLILVDVFLLDWPWSCYKATSHIWDGNTRGCPACRSQNGKSWSGSGCCQRYRVPGIDSGKNQKTEVQLWAALIIFLLLKTVTEWKKSFIYVFVRSRLSDSHTA